MSKYKVGQRVRVRDDLIRGRSYGTDSAVQEMLPLAGQTVTITRVKEDKYEIKEDSWNWTDEMFVGTAEKGETPVQRRTFKQLKDSVTVKKNALWQEACDDGTQEYILLDSADNKDSRNTQRIYDRSLVEDNASNFVEVFAVHPAYMTREDLDRWEAFQKAEAKPARKPRAKATKTAKKVTRTSKAKAA